MNTKHTPGPWIAKEQYRDCVTNDVGHFVMWQDKSKPGVMLRRLDDKKGAFSAADARLIAGAPELFSACKQANTVLEDYVHGKSTEMCAMAEALVALSAAIRKARL